MSYNKTLVRAEFGENWRLVVAGATGFAFSSIVASSTGPFMKPLGDAFGWGKAMQASGTSITAAITFLLSPIFGILIDRWGTRRMALGGIVAAALIISCFATLIRPYEYVQWIALWAVYAFAGVMIKSTVWAAAVSSVFREGRGLALGLTLSGTAVALMIIPKTTQVLIDTIDWRLTYVALGLGGGLIAFFTCYFWLFDGYDKAKAEKGLAARGTTPLLDDPGLSLEQAWRDSALWRIAISTFLMMVVTIALNVHQFEILVASGLTRSEAGSYSAIAGATGIAGKLITGWLLDRYHVRWAGGITLGLSAIAFALLLIPNPTLLVIISAIAINGYAAGTKLQIASFATSAYGGLRNFGAIFGSMASLIAAGSGLGPVLAGMVYDRYNSYNPFLILGIIVSLISSFLIMSLGAYPGWGKKEVSERSATLEN